MADARQRPVGRMAGDAGQADAISALPSGQQLEKVVPSARSRSSVDASSQFRHHDNSRTRSNPAFSSSSTRFYVSVGPTAFCVCWLVILLFHAACLVFCVGAAWVYAAIPSTLLAYLVSTKSLAIDMKHFPLVPNIYAVIAASHAFFIAKMLVTSIANRQLAFF